MVTIIFDSCCLLCVQRYYLIFNTELREIHKGIKAEALAGLTEMNDLRQVDFRFIDSSKGRIAALRKQMYEASKEQLLYENISEEKRIPSIALEHLSTILM
ncbi:hypothetical protein [Paenibacillus sp. 1011MAR3C5]|uniref:hypothetical protein n=1 Tax=Paenibacillus sp. 1011MAR3C5 TaxID=1675787 RepID=UPI002176080A|nr:hypothetical protein [Paenibacillus sp. 1011MAR3C5]